MESPYKVESNCGTLPLSPVHEEAMKKRIEELKRASEPLIDYLYKYGSPYTTVMVTMDSIRVAEDSMGIPLEVRD